MHFPFFLKRSKRLIKTGGLHGITKKGKKCKKKGFCHVHSKHSSRAAVLFKANCDKTFTGKHYVQRTNMLKHTVVSSCLDVENVSTSETVNLFSIYYLIIFN